MRIEIVSTTEREQTRVLIDDQDNEIVSVTQPLPCPDQRWVSSFAAYLEARPAVEQLQADLIEEGE